MIFTVTKKILATLFLVGSCFSCMQVLEPADRTFIDWESIERSSEALDSGSCTAIEGVYLVSAGSAQFGDTIVLRWNGKRLCLYTKVDVIFAELAGGKRGDSLYFEGYYTIVRAANSNSILLHLDTVEPGKQIVLQGSFDGNERLRLERIRDVKRSATPFYIIAHRGGGRNSDRLLRSENSIEMMKFATTLGANGVEIDIQRTRDHKLIVFHDETFSPRTVRGSYLFGDVSAFSLQDIKRYGRLVYGETIPTLEEMLIAAIDSTSLELVWLDVKAADVTEDIIKAQQSALTYAKDRGRTINIVFGIPTDEVLSAYKASPSVNTTPVLCELSADVAKSLPTCKIWAPRWTNGTQRSEVESMHASNIQVVTWTLDVKDYMQQFLSENTFDGILSNYPSLLCAMYY